MSVEQKSVDAIRILSTEAIQRAKSGHPGICRLQIALPQRGKTLQSKNKNRKGYAKEIFYQTKCFMDGWLCSW